MRCGKVDSTWWRERSKVKIFFSSAIFFPDISICFCLQNPGGMILKELCLLFLAFCDLHSMRCEEPAASPKKYEIEWRFILDMLQCHSLNLTFYELSPFPSDFSPFPPTMLLCNDLCRARDFTFSLLSACNEYVALYRYRMIKMLQNGSLKVFLHYIGN